MRKLCSYPIYCQLNQMVEHVEISLKTSILCITRPRQEAAEKCFLFIYLLIDFVLVVKGLKRFEGLKRSENFR